MNLLSWNESGRQFDKGFTLWTSLLKARASNIQIVIGVRFTGLFLYFVRCAVILVNRGKKKKVYLSKFDFSWPNENFILETLAPQAGCAFFVVL